jgi:large subunit ribosomal protein LP2
MRYIAAYLLLQCGGNASPSANDIKKVLSSVDIDVDDARLSKLISELEGKSIDSVSLIYDVHMYTLTSFVLYS